MTDADSAPLPARDDAAAAEPVLRRAVDAWELAAAPYEAARGRLLLAGALYARGDPRAAAEVDVAAVACRSLGAQRDLQAALDLASNRGRGSGSRADDQQVRLGQDL